MVDDPDIALRISRLTEDQSRCLGLVAQQYNSKEIARRLGVSPHTVDQRLRRAIEILGVSSRFEAARLLASQTDEALPYQALAYQPPQLHSDSDSKAPLASATGIPPGVERQPLRFTDQVADWNDGWREHPKPVWPIPTAAAPFNRLPIASRIGWIILLAVGLVVAGALLISIAEGLSRIG